MLVATLLLLQTLTSNPTIGPAPTKHIPRFQMIDTGLYRGGQPEREGFEYLKQTGIKTVINFRTENDEEPFVKALGMKYVHIPVSIKMWTQIPDQVIEEYFKVLNDPANYPIFFHCRRGADRTGAMAGFYRIVAQGWQPKKAYDEARDLGMRWWYRAIKGQIEKFDTKSVALTKTAEAAP